jgi:hypothetical protein
MVWAKDMNGELPNPGVTVDFITDIKEVTKDILAGTDNLSGADLKKSMTTSMLTKKRRK